MDWGIVLRLLLRDGLFWRPLWPRLFLFVYKLLCLKCISDVHAYQRKEVIVKLRQP